MRTLLDTNILVRNVLEDDPLYQQVHEALERMVGHGCELCICAQNVYEFWSVATRPRSANGLGFDVVRTRQEVDVMVSTYTLLTDPPDLMDHWLALCSHYAVIGRPSHDARLVALMIGTGIDHIFSLNSADFARYSEITCLGPAEV